MVSIMSSRFPVPGETWYQNGMPTKHVFQWFNDINNLYDILNLGIVPNVIYEDLNDINNRVRQPEEGYTLWVKDQTLPIEQAIYYGGQWVSTIDGLTPIV